MTDQDLDALIDRLAARARDPQRRADVIVDAFSESVQTLDLGALFAAGMGAAARLGRAVEEIRATGTVSEASRRAADAAGEAMRRPAREALPAPAAAAAVQALEAEAGGRLPDALRRAYLEIADGGFGPGAGLLPIAEVAEIYRAYRSASPGPRGSTWPEGVLPIVDRNPGYDCVDVGSGRILDWNPEDLRERSNDATWRRSFTPVADDPAAWLDAWVASRTVAEQAQDRMAEMQVREARRVREMLREQGPAYRAAMGLPDVGWERVVWGGIGLEEDDAGED